ENLYHWSIRDLNETFKMTMDQATRFYQDLHTLDLQKILHDILQHEIYPVTPLDPFYPPLLLQIYDPPWVLYCQGNLSLLKSSHSLAVVGTRYPSYAGLKSLEMIIPPLI